jgi:hypothetical protein
MTPDRPRVDWLFVATWTAIGLAALAFATGILWLAGKVWRAVWPVLWPWVQANSDGLTLGLGIAVVLGAVVALAVEDRR